MNINRNMRRIKDAVRYAHHDAFRYANKLRTETVRRDRLLRFLSSRPHVDPECRGKRSFGSQRDAIAATRAQIPYRCPSCAWWHLAPHRVPVESRAIHLALNILLVIAIALVLVFALGCKPKRATADDPSVWRGTPGPLTCGDEPRPDERNVYTCVGYGRVYTCIRLWSAGAFDYDCAPNVPAPSEGR